MKYFRYISFILFILSSSSGVAQSWKWVQRGGGPGYDDYWGITLSRNKACLYSTGPFEQTIAIGLNTLTSFGNNDVVIAKYDTSGNVLWAKHAGGGPGFDSGTSICEDDSSNIYVTGIFNGIAIFDNDTLRSQSSGNCSFLAKYDFNAHLVWIKQTSGTGTCFSNAVLIDKMGNIVIGGQYTDSILFGATTVVSQGLGDCFLAKYTPMGNLMWVETGGGAGDDAISGIAVDSANNIVCSGWFSQTAHFGSNVVTGGPNSHVLITKFSSAGINLWADKSGGSGTSAGSWNSIDSQGNSYVVGSFSGTIQFDSTSITSSGSNDIFIIKTDKDGLLKWVKRLGDTGNDMGYGIATDNSGNSFITGMFALAAPGQQAGYTNFFVTKYDSSGAFKWLKLVSGKPNANGRAASIVSDNCNNIYIGGDFTSICYFDSDSIQSAGNWDMCIAKLHDEAGFVNSVAEFSKSFQVNAFPNPFMNNLMLTINGIQNQNVEISLLNLLGQEFYSGIINSGYGNYSQISIPCNNLSSGTYLLKIRAATGAIKCLKLVKN